MQRLDGVTVQFWIGLLVINPHTKFEVCILSRSVDIEVSQNLKVDHVTQAVFQFDLVLQIFG